LSPSEDLIVADSSTNALQQTPLYSLHTELKARMVPFSGWEMPVQYRGITQEHQAVREQAGMFDISHMGKFEIIGPDLLNHLQTLVPSDLSQLKPGQAQYTVLLNTSGGILDDLIIYYQGEMASGDQRITTIVNAATTEKDKAWLTAQLDLPGITFIDHSPSQSLLAVQGPAATDTLQKFVTEDLSAIPRFGHLEGTVLDQPGFLARTGYTGEDGFEVMVAPEVGQKLWRSLLEAGVTPCGLGARDTLRLEAAMLLYGQDMDDSTTPLEAGLGWLVHLDRKGDFLGRSVLEQQKQDGVKRRIIGLQMEGRNIARHDYPVLHDGVPVGVVTSGTLSPSLKQAIALAYVPPELAKPGQSLVVEIRGKACPAQVVKRPFLKK
jgi:aminomethyltransferase